MWVLKKKLVEKHYWIGFEKDLKMARKKYFKNKIVSFEKPNSFMLEMVRGFEFSKE